MTPECRAGHTLQRSGPDEVVALHMANWPENLDYVSIRELPDTVLEKVYQLNAERLFHQFRGGAQERKASQ